MTTNYLEKLQDLFPNHWQIAIEQVISDVEEEIPMGSDEEKLERMCTLLIENFANESVNFGSDSESDEEESNSVLRDKLLRRFPLICPKFLDDFLQKGTCSDYTAIVQNFEINGYVKKNQTDDAASSGSTANSTRNLELIEQMLQLFPDACEKYINQCINEGLELDALIDKFTSSSYVKATKKSPKDGLLLRFHQRLCDMLPKFDPDFLLEEAKKMPQLTEAALSNCIATLLDMKEFPTIAGYKKRQDQKTKMLNYIFDVKIDLFLKEFNYNLKRFENAKKHSLSEPNGSKIEFENDKRMANVILSYVYPEVAPNVIEKMLKQHKFDIVQCCSVLGQVQRKVLLVGDVDLPPNSYTNKLLFQELAYVLYRDLIKNFLNVRTVSYEKAYKTAEAAKQLRTCKTCFDDGLLLMPDEVFQCRNGCEFCKQCMIRGCEVAYNDGSLDIECFDKCGATFSDNILQMVMDPLSYYKLINRKEIREIREARVDGFETCPFCDDDGKVMHQDDKVFVCQNPECGKESCRECKHEAHIPLRCNEIEYDEDVKMRTYIEEEMAAAMIRVCKKCNRQIVKEQGCNKMTCVCGQTMCYVCGLSGINYAHFGAACQQMSDQDALHRSDILKRIQVAKAKLGVDKNPNKLKFDPSEGF